jgi:phospho-N-acetylmuramoyl-pentapeptide-transferase
MLLAMLPLLWSLSAAAGAQAPAPAPAVPQVPQVIATGAGELQASPDLAVIRLAVETTGTEAARAGQDNAARMSSLRQALEKAGIPASVRLNFIDADIHLGWLYPVFVYLVVAGATSAVNLTDGLDGLAAGCCAIVLLAYIGITYITNGQAELALLCGCLVGACIGFLWFNSFPASIFMGDTGSLGLGGALAGLAVMTRTEILLVLLGGIFVLEALSVLIQVASFRLFRRRVFLMAPIHHHFEMRNWSETKIILRFWIVAAACSAIAFTLYQSSLK